jgi:hypothetical protein
MIFWLFESVWALVFILVSYLILGKFQLSPLVTGICFIITGLVNRFFIDGNDVFLYKKHKTNNLIADRIGVIDLFIITLMAIVLGLILHFRQMPLYTDTSFYNGTLFEELSLKHEHLQFWIDKEIYVLTSFVISFGVLITLLWTNSNWTNLKWKKKVYKQTVLTSLKILLALVLIFLTCSIYLINPLFSKQNSIIQNINKVEKCTD